MAGLLIKELKMRGAVGRTLVVVPGPLREQWRWEMRDKFDERFEIVGREEFRRDGRHVWRGNQIITSMDFAKKTDVLDSFQTASFDLVVVDEAHKMSAYRSGGSTSKTRRYRLGETLSSASRHLLFLTATPHKGDPANFRLLLDLLEPGYFAAETMMSESVRDKSNPLFLRRAKEDMVDFDGRPLFVPRRVETPDVSLSAPERAAVRGALPLHQEAERAGRRLRPGKQHRLCPGAASAPVRLQHVRPQGVADTPAGQAGRDGRRKPSAGCISNRSPARRRQHRGGLRGGAVE